MPNVPEELQEKLTDANEVGTRCSNRVLVTLRRMRGAEFTPGYAGLLLELAEAIQEFSTAHSNQTTLFMQVLDLFLTEPESHAHSD
jgi:hypothetical protein